MKPFDALRNRARLGAPTREDTFHTLAKPAQLPQRRVRTGRTEQFNVRVSAAFKQRVEALAANNKETIGRTLEIMLADHESGAASPQHGVPAGEARAGRTKALRLWATDEVFGAIGKVAAERKLSVSGLIEDLLAREIARLDPHGGKYGVNVGS